MKPGLYDVADQYSDLEKILLGALPKGFVTADNFHYL
jgi:hypothetical protein